MKKIFCRIILIAMILNLLLQVLNQNFTKAEPKVIRVPLDQPTIQDAINVASAGDTIYVYSGIYSGFTVWSSRPCLLIEGENPMTTFVDGSITIEADNTTIAGFTIRSSTVTIQYSCGNVIRSNKITQNSYVYLYYTINNTVEYNLIDGNSSSGIDLYSSSRNIIRRNWIYHHYSGISLFYSFYNIIIGNTIENNVWGVYSTDSGYNDISQNNITKNEYGVFMRRSRCNLLNKNTLMENELGIDLFRSGDNTLRNNIFLANEQSFLTLGFELSDYLNDIDTSNTIDSKPIYYLINQDNLIIDPMAFPNPGCLVLVNSTYIVVTNLTLTQGSVLFAFTDHSTIQNLNIFRGHIWLDHSNNNIVNDNNITNYNQYTSFYLFGGNNVVTRNTIIGNETYAGMALHGTFNYVVENNVVNHAYGILLDGSNNTLIYHNNFINNKNQTAIINSFNNSWDDGYPSGGNYWSDYIGVDYYSGPNQDKPGSDGIGDTPYVIDANNRDRYPLMNPYGAPSPLAYFLTITTTAGGTTNPSPRTYSYAAGAELNVTAIPNTGYSFAYWLLDGQNRTENPITILMNANHTLEAYFVDDIKPEIGEPSQNPPPENVQPYEDVIITVTVVDYGSGVKNVTLWYSLNNGTTWTILNMTELAANTFQATIPGYGNCTWVSYKIVAYDNAGNNATKDNMGYYYKYHVIPEFQSSIIIPLFMTVTLLATIKYGRKHIKRDRG